MKKLSLLINIIIITLSLFLLGACNEETQYGEDFDIIPVPPHVDYVLDSGVEIDGEFNESMWDGQEWYEVYTSDGRYSNSGGSLAGRFDETRIQVTTVFADKGFYLAAKVDDKFLVSYNNNKRNEHWVTDKTGLTVYFAPINAESIYGNAWQITAAADGEIEVAKCLDVASGYKEYLPSYVAFASNVINPQLDEFGNGTCDGYYMEFYFSYKMLDLESKPEEVMIGFASIRHENASGKTPRAFERVVGNWQNPSTWVPFNENGVWNIPTTADYTIDGDISDWQDYEGKEHRIELFSVDENGKATEVDVDPRFVSNKMIKGSDGLYISTEALQRIYLTDADDYWRNTSVEMKLFTSTGSTVTIQYGANGYATGKVKSVWACKDSGIVYNGENLKLITNEAFIPNFALELWGISTDDDINATWAFRNGRYQLSLNDALETYTLELNETKTAQFIGASSVQPFIFAYYGTSTYGGSPFSVGEEGIKYGTYSDEKYELDGRATEWSDYKGVHAFSTGRMEADGNLDSVNKGYDVMVRKGKDGIYFYATVKHSTWKTNDVLAHMNSNLALGFGITNVNPTANNAEFYRGNEIFFMSTGVSHPKATMWMSDTGAAQKDENGLYTTIIEGFVPYEACFYNVTDKLAKIFDVKTGKVKEGYSLRVGVHWRTNGENAAMQGWAARADWQGIDSYGVPAFSEETLNQQSNGWRTYYLSDSGLHTSAIEAKYRSVDGKDVDWNSYDARSATEKLVNANEGTSVEYKAMLREDGLYILAKIKMKNYYVSNAYTYDQSGNVNKVNLIDFTQQWYRNTYISLNYKTSDGKSGWLGYITPFTTGGGSYSASFHHGADTVWKVDYDGTYYNSTVETFYSFEQITKSIGSTKLPEKMSISFEYSSFNDNGIPSAPANDICTGSEFWKSGKYFILGYNGMYQSEIAPSRFLSKATVNFKDGFDGKEDVAQKTGEPIEIIESITLGDEELIYYRDYIVVYENNVNVGTATWVVKGVNEYSGKISGSFTIYDEDYTESITTYVSDLVFYRTESGVKAKVIVLNDGEILTEGKDYLLTYENTNGENAVAGEDGYYLGSVTVTFIGKFSSVEAQKYDYKYKL